jgi:uncharacterized protein (UPF0276 family)
MVNPSHTAGTVPAKAGIGLRAKHYKEILATLPAIGWFEGHSENYFAEGGQPLYYLEQVRAHYPLSLHGVGLSLGSTDPLNRDHLQKLQSLVRRFEPGLVSEHLSWGSVGGRYLNDLLPLPYTEEALAHVASRIGQVQEFLGRQLLIENVSSYLQFNPSTIPEWEFLAETAVLSGCGILLDVNNIYVNAVNHRFDPGAYLQAIPVEAVQEYHLAGFDRNGDLLIDTHGKPVYGEVWQLYRQALDRFGILPTLIEWDTDIPELPVLLAEANKADAIMMEMHDELVA